MRFFVDLPDPRAANKFHKLHDLLVIAVCAVPCGAGGWVEVGLFGRSKQAWLKTFLDLPGGILSHDTFGRVFAALRPEAYERCFAAWVSALAQSSQGRLIAIDGKAIRRSDGCRHDAAEHDASSAKGVRCACDVRGLDRGD